MAQGDLAGTWDAIGTNLAGTPTSATITINQNTLSITTERGSLVATRQGEDFSITYTRGDQTTPMQLTRTLAGNSSLGEFPLHLSGAWRISDVPDDGLRGCSTTLDMSQLTAQCREIGGRLPGFLPNPENQAATGSKVQSLPSIFGDLGGVWEIRSADSLDQGSCLVRFEAQSFSVNCNGSRGFNGTLEAELNGSMLSGRTGRGLEFSAQRR